MKSGRFSVLLRVVALAVASAVAIGCAGLLRRTDQSNHPSAEVEQRLTSVRGLEFVQAVPIAVKGPQDAASLTLDRAESRISGSRLRQRTEVWKKIGLYYYGTDLRATTLRTASSEVAAFYDPKGREVVLVREDDVHGSSGTESKQHQVLLAHELTHALQYQHFQIDKNLDAAAATYDSYLAFNAVLEGDATFTSLAYAQRRRLNRKTIEDMKARIREASFSQTVVAKPQRADQVIEYVYGTLFVMEAFERGGWDGVNRLYSQPPRSCREIMEPALYFRRIRPPLAINVAGFEHVMEGWTVSDRDTLGVVPLKEMLTRGVKGKDRQVGLSLRWSDDQMIVLRKDNQLAAVWMIAFDDSDSAWAFQQAYTPVLDSVALGEPHLIERRDRRLLVTIGEAATRSGSLNQMVWGATKLDDGDPAEMAAAGG